MRLLFYYLHAFLLQCFNSAFVFVTATLYKLFYFSYLELAILPCWRFLVDDSADVIQRLIAMMRGLGNPLASAYCHLYLVYCVQKLPLHDNGIFDLNLFNKFSFGVLCLYVFPFLASSDFLISLLYLFGSISYYLFHRSRKALANIRKVLII